MTLSSLRRTAVSVFSVMVVGALGTSPLSAQEGAVTGEVVNATTGQPLSGAQVVVSGTGLGTITGDEGTFRITGVPAGTQSVQVQLLGYAPQTTSVEVAAGQTASVTFRLEQSAVQLEQIIVTGTAGETRRRELGNSVSQIGAEQIDDAPVNNVSDVLNGRSAGVVVQQGTGVVGSASKITIRGRSSMSLDNSPIIYVDGVRVNSRTEGAFADPAISRLDDLNPRNIESIEVIKGPAAATLYGTEASNGVIQIITKGGVPGETRVNLQVSGGANWLPDPSDAFMMPSYWYDAASGDVNVVDLIEQEREAGRPIFRTGATQSYSLSVQGGASDVQYYMSGTAGLQEGASPENDLKKYSGQVNLTASPAAGLQVQGKIGGVVNRIDLMRQGVRGVIPSIMWGRPTEENLSSPSRGFHVGPPEALRDAYNSGQDVNRFTPTLTVDHRPTDWLRHRLSAGIDFSDTETVQFTPRLGPQSAQFFSENFAAGSKDVEREEALFTTLDYSASASLPLTDDFSSSTSAGLQIYTKRREITVAQGERFPAAGIKTVAGAGRRFGSDNVVENNTIGVYVQEQIGWKDRLFVTGAVRADDNSAFGEDFDVVYYPKVSMSWVLSEEPFFDVGWVNSLRLRGAYGESGSQPDVFAALRSFEPRPTPSGDVAVTPQAVGNDSLGPERGKEFEAGLEASFLDERLSASFTYYDQRTTDAILSRNVAPSTGFPGQQFVNVGEIHNWGTELTVNGRPVESSAVDWDLGVSLSTLNNEITELGLESFLSTGWVGRHQEGYSVGSLWAHDVVSAEYNSDTRQVESALCASDGGEPVPCLSESSRQFAGHPQPDFEGSVNTTVGLFDRLRIRGLLDFKVGQSKYLTEWWNRCNWRQVCEINAYPERYSPEEVAATQMGLADEFQLWVQESSFARLRELSVNYALPSRVTSLVGADDASITVAGRNLGTWTDWGGIDPETLNLAFSDDTPEGQAMMPPLTQFTATVNVSF